MFVEQSLYSKEWTSPFLKHSLPLVIDVGANAGVFTHFLVLMNPNVEIIAFEPLPAMAVRIEARIASTGMNAKVKRAACSDRCGKQKLYFSSIDDTTASLQADNCDDKKEIAVAVRTLDSEMPERRDVFLVKIDAEGHELAVLRGAEQTIKKTSYLIIEANSCEAFERVRNFLGEQWFPQKLDLNNYLFLKKGKRPSHSVN